MIITACFLQGLTLGQIIIPLTSIISTIIIYLIKNKINQSLEFNKIKYLKLHENRALIIQNLYYLAHELKESISDEVQSKIQSSDSKIDEFKELSKAFSASYKKDKIYFSQETWGNLENINSFYIKIINKIESINKGSFNTSKHNEWERLFKNTNDHLDSLLTDLEQNFKAILGVDLDHKT